MSASSPELNVAMTTTLPDDGPLFKIRNASSFHDHRCVWSSDRRGRVREPPGTDSAEPGSQCSNSCGDGYGINRAGGCRGIVARPEWKSRAVVPRRGHRWLSGTLCHRCGSSRDAASAVHGYAGADWRRVEIRRDDRTGDGEGVRAELFPRDAGFRICRGDDSGWWRECVAVV